ncbi:hypothetical protein PCANC_04429 [Puccinia coronata f. sp. avenae]|uniref:Uncharacterized protein n=1 Tax=Puccinia coronata f. sp. avenae TaxID=200324 RepID=A0A2N5VUV2_9BASI|nr:hypothetical protein PCANC_04429 [Puccinia coronata f. sp. avenae]
MKLHQEDPQTMPEFATVAWVKRMSPMYHHRKNRLAVYPTRPQGQSQTRQDTIKQLLLWLTPTPHQSVAELLVYLKRYLNTAQILFHFSKG